MVIVCVNECCNTVHGRSQFVFLVFVHLLLIGLNGTNGEHCVFVFINYFAFVVLIS